MEPDEARLVHLHQVDHQRRDDARHQGQDVREQRPGAIIGRPARAVALRIVALLAVALLAVALLAVSLLAVSLLAVALLAPLAVALRALLAVALGALLAVALRAVLRVSGVVHGGTSPFLGRGGPSAEPPDRMAQPAGKRKLRDAPPDQPHPPGSAGQIRPMVASHACAVGVP